MTVAGIRPIGRSDPAAAPVVLASASRVRRMILARAGVPLRAESPRIDEDEVKTALRAESAPAARVTETLAELKARRVARRNPGALVIGADQVLECNGIWFDKPADREQAVAHLRALSGKEHVLMTSACVLRDETRLWHHTELARLRLRSLSEAFIEDYLATVGDEALTSLGAYQLEGLGAQLFARIEGDYFAILGLPLLPLLDFLRSHKVVPQ